MYSMTRGVVGQVISDTRLDQSLLNMKKEGFEKHFSGPSWNKYTMYTQ